jgi:hypothetical protein
MSKRVPQIGQAGGQVVGLSLQFGVHPGSREKRDAAGGVRNILET